MLGGNHIRSGVLFGLLSAALIGCSVPAPFVHAPAPAHPAPALEPAPVVDESQTPAVPAPAAQAAQEGPDLWRRIGAQLELHLDPRHAPTNPLARLQYGKSFIERATAQSEPYLYYVVSELDKRDLPYEIALIPLIESAYDPAAGSARGPAGMWQLIPSTGDRFGLGHNRWYDGRRDVVASTEAALHYFQQLRDHFDGDWLLAVAAYNCGERAVAEAIARNRQRGKPTDFWSLSLPGNTRKYIDRLLAVSAVLAEPEAYGVTPAVVRDRPYFDVADVGRNLPLSRIVVASGLSADELRRLNPAFSQQLTVDGATRVLVAHGHGDDVALALSSVSDDVRRLPSETAARGNDVADDGAAPRRDHVVRAGDSLSQIAARAGVTVEALRLANHLDSANLRVGQVLHLPVKAPATQPQVAANGATSPRVTVQPRTAVHVVREGDNLWDVARQYHVSAEALADANELAPRSVLKLGQTLRLPTPDGAGVAHAPGAAKVALAVDDPPEQSYEVRQGDSLWTISRRFNVSVDALKKWNRLPAGGVSLQPGQRLVVNGET